MPTAPAEELKTIEQSVMAILEREATVGKTESWGQRPLYYEAKSRTRVFFSITRSSQSKKIEQINQDFKVTLVLKSTICRAS